MYEFENSWSNREECLEFYDIIEGCAWKLLWHLAVYLQSSANCDTEVLQFSLIHALHLPS